MSDTLPKITEGPDSPRVKERPNSFIDGIAFLEGVVIKTMASPQGDSEAANKTLTRHTASVVPIRAEPHDQIETEDWDSLFGAVEERLRTTVDQLDTATTPVVAADKVSRIKSVVLDCVSALDMLHKALKNERSTHGQVSGNGPNTDAAVAPLPTKEHSTSLNN
jgi:hypothetical protein